MNKYEKEIITLDILSKAIANSLDMKEEEAKESAEYVLDIFGFNSRIIDNVLMQEDRQLFYLLEEVGLMATERETNILYDEREWRTFYWKLKKNIIIKYSRKVIREPKREEYAEEKDIYSTLSDEIWERRGYSKL